MRLTYNSSGPTQAELEARLLDEERTHSSEKSSTTVIAEGLKLEEAQ